MDNVSFMKIVDCGQDLFDCLRCIFFCKLALVANSIEELSTSSQLSNDVVFVLGKSEGLSKDSD